MVCLPGLRSQAALFRLNFCCPHGLCENFQVGEYGFFFASSIIILAYQFLKPAMDSVSTEVLLLYRFSETDVCAPKRIFLGDVFKSSFN